jgi:Na+-driven multidrug efflux pump
MSQDPYQPSQQYGNVQPAPSNGLGIAGFVVSLVGLIPCGLLCPLGALLSLIAVFRQPRGFAIAGLIIGTLGSIMLAAVVVMWWIRKRRR